MVVARFAAPEVTGESPLLSGRGWVVVARIVEVQHAIDLLAAHGRSTRGAAVPLAVALALTFAALVQPGSQAVAQAVEVEDREEGPKKRTGASRPTPPEGQVYTWKDGGRSSRAFLQADLVVSREGAVSAVGTPVARTPQGRIVRVASASEVEGQPVFRSSSGALMTLPGGVLLVFDPDWGEAETDAFFAAHGIATDRVSPLGAIPNGFVVATEPGFASLELANALAGLDGVKLSSPNWWRERTTR